MHGGFPYPALTGNKRKKSFVGVLDAYTSGLTLAVSSKRRLASSYESHLIRVRSSAVGSPEQNIGYDGTGAIDSSALTTFVGSDSGYIKTLYNQYPDSGIENFAQSTASSQPRIINAGTLENEGGMSFDGSDDKLVLPTFDIRDMLSSNSGQIWLRIKTNNPPNNGRVVDVTGAGTGFWCPFSGSVYWDFASSSTGRINTTTPTGIVGSWADVSLEKDGGTSRIRVNGTVAVSGSTSATLSSATVDVVIGNLVAGGGAWKGLLKEMVVWNDGTAATCVNRCAALA